MKAVVIGGGLAGLTAAIRLLEGGAKVTMITAGVGGMQLSQGTLDVLGYCPDRLENPFDGFPSLPEHHPYRVLDTDTVRSSVASIANELGLAGTENRNLWLPTAVGAIRPTAWAPPSLAGADVHEVSSFAVVGVRQLKDFQADLIAGNLSRTELGGRRLTATPSWIDFEPRRGEVDPSAVHFAQALDAPEKLVEFASRIRASAGPADMILVPAVIGLREPTAWDKFVEAVGRPVAEVAMQPPNVPGIRINNALLARARELGMRHVQGAFVEGFNAQGSVVRTLVVTSGGRRRSIGCDAVVHAPGGFESGGLKVDSRGLIEERVFGLPLTSSSAEGLLSDDVWAAHPLFEVGVRVDERMRPVDEDGAPVFENLYTAGGLLAGAQRWQEKSGDGIAVASAARAATSILGGAA